MFHDMTQVCADHLMYEIPCWHDDGPPVRAMTIVRLLSRWAQFSLRQTCTMKDERDLHGTSLFIIRIPRFTLNYERTILYIRHISSSTCKIDKEKDRRELWKKTCNIDKIYGRSSSQSLRQARCDFACLGYDVSGRAICFNEGGGKGFKEEGWVGTVAFLFCVPQQRVKRWTYLDVTSPESRVKNLRLEIFEVHGTHRKYFPAKACTPYVCVTISFLLHNHFDYSFLFAGWKLFLLMIVSE